MQLGFVTAIFPHWSLEQVLAFAQAERYDCIEVMCWPKGGADRKVIERFFRKHNLADRVQTTLICGLIDVVKEYVLRGIGVALMYVTDEVGRSTPGLHLRPLDPEIERLPIEMAVRKGGHLPEHVEEFRRAVRQCLAVPGGSRHLR